MEMAREGRSNVILRTIVMLGALGVLLMMAFLPGTVGWLANGQSACADRATQGSTSPSWDAVRDQRDAATESRGAGESQPGQLVRDAEADGVRAESGRGPWTKAGSGANAAEAVRSGEAFTAERFAEVTGELRRLGAAYYRLESWEGRPGIVRFQCSVPVTGRLSDTDPGYRTFEAADRDVSAAMERVLADVLVWRAQGRY
jgi:hypothetical protein